MAMETNSCDVQNKYIKLILKSLKTRQWQNYKSLLKFE